MPGSSTRGPSSLPPGPPALPKAWGRRGVPLSAAGLDTLRASVKLHGLERQTDRGRETNSWKTRQAAEPTPRGSVFAPNNVEQVLGQFVSKSARQVPGAVLTEASLVLKVNQSWPRPWGSGLRVRGSPGGLGGAAVGSWALVRCSRLQSAACASGCRGGSQAFVRMTLGSGGGWAARHRLAIEYVFIEHLLCQALF